MQSRLTSELIFYKSHKNFPFRWWRDYNLEITVRAERTQRVVGVWVARVRVNGLHKSIRLLWQRGAMDAKAAAVFVRVVVVARNVLSLTHTRELRFRRRTADTAADEGSDYTVSKATTSVAMGKLVRARVYVQRGEGSDSGGLPFQGELVISSLLTAATSRGEDTGFGRSVSGVC